MSKKATQPNTIPQSRKPTPRETLAAAHASLRELQTRAAGLQAEADANQRIIDAQRDAENVLTGIAASEKAELDGWIRNPVGEQPALHDAERTKAAAQGRLTTARADVARSKLVELRTAQDAMRPQFEVAQQQIRNAVLAVLVEELTRVAIQYRQAAALAATIKAQLDAFTRAVPGQFPVENFGSLSAEIGNLMEGQPVNVDHAIIADRSAWLKWLNALGVDANAELPEPAAVELEVPRPVHVAAPRFEPRGPIPEHPGVRVYHHG